VSGASLARWAERIALGARLRLGKGEEMSGGRTKESLLATAFEAVLGVVYLEGGLPAARRVIARLAGW
jgi:ribonuclease-3